MDSIDIYRSAHLRVVAVGFYAAQRADEMLEKGDLDGKAVWIRILKATEDLLSTEIGTRH